MSGRELVSQYGLRIMVNFIARTRLVQITDPVTKEPVEPADVRAFAGKIANREDLDAKLARGEKEVLVDLDAYEIVHDLDCYYEATLIGSVEEINGKPLEIPTSVFEVRVWMSQADRDNGQRPAWTDSHTFQHSPKPDADHKFMIERAIRDSIRRCSLRDGGGDERDMRIVRYARDTPTSDDHPIRSKAVQEIHEAPVVLTPPDIAIPVEAAR